MRLKTPDKFLSKTTPRIINDHANIKSSGKSSTIIPEYDITHEDLTKSVKNEKAGAKGMSTQQVVRAAIILRKEDYSYDEPAFHLADSSTFQYFCDIGIYD